MSSSTSNMTAIMPCKTMRGHTSWIRGIVHLPDEGHIITCSWDESFRLWNLKSGTQIGEDWRYRNDNVWIIALSPNGKTIASGSENGDMRLWDVETRKVIIATWTGHSDIMCTLSWSEDGERVASGSLDGTARIWDVNSNLKNILTIKTGCKW